MYGNGPRRHSGHLKFTYSGLYPVLEFQLDAGDRSARQYNPVFTDTEACRFNEGLLELPYVCASAKIYVPLKFQSGGWYRGLIPSLTFRMSNDVYRTSILQVNRYASFIGERFDRDFSYLNKGNDVYYRGFVASLRGYVVCGTAGQGVYPRWGGGVEIGASESMAAGLFPPQAFASAYGYLPGIMPSHGFKVCLKGQMSLSTSCPFAGGAINTLPRGFAKVNPVDYGRASALFTVDYAIPFSMGDFDLLRGLLHINRGVVTPFFDRSVFRTSESSASGAVISTGGTVSFNLTNLAWIPLDCTVGVSLCYNGGRSYDHLSASGRAVSHFYAGPVMSVDF